MPPIVIVTGPTASGKSALAVAAAHHLAARSLPAEILCIDSVQLIRGTRIGGGGPTPEERETVPHHLFELLDPKELSNAWRYLELATPCLADLHTRGTIPVLVGGTGLYIKALLYGLSEAPGRDDATRRQLEAEALAIGTPALHARLTTIDPATASRLASNDTTRVIRAIEVYAVTGRTLSSFHATHTLKPRYNALHVALNPNREWLRERIARRVAKMFDDGFIDEVRALRDLAGDSATVLRATGFREVAAYLRNELSRDEAIAKTIIAHGQYAKRQLTWLRRQPNVTWLDAPAQPTALAALIEAHITSHTDTTTPTHHTRAA